MVTSTVPVRIPCPRCGTVGFVRVEHVIKGGKSYRSMFCGQCDYQWQVAETDAHIPGDEHEKPDRSR